jgi:hypothetical protein
LVRAAPRRFLARVALLALVFIDELPRDPGFLEPKNLQEATAEYFWEVPE